jgi:FHS family L-fucose permease-like MFS transporter
LSGLSVLQNRKLILATIAIFVALGAEAGLFGLYRNYVEDPDVAGLTSHKSYLMFTLFFAVFAAGRLAGSIIQKRIKPVKTLICSVSFALFLLLMVIILKGTFALIAITIIGFFISIFFPTLYAIAIEGLGGETGVASGMLTMGFLGAAIMPVFQGKLADMAGLKISFIVGIAAYIYILYFAVLNLKKTN